MSPCALKAASVAQAFGQYTASDRPVKATGWLHSTASPGSLIRLRRPAGSFGDLIQQFSDAVDCLRVSLPDIVFTHAGKPHGNSGIAVCHTTV